MAAPMSGKTMKAQTCLIGRLSGAKGATARERAGFTDVFDTGIEIRWTSHRATPAARPPKPAGNLGWVVLITANTKMAVIRTSKMATEPRPKPAGEPLPQP